VQQAQVVQKLAGQDRAVPGDADGTDSADAGGRRREAAIYR